jgi:hypothetical protein
MRYIIFWSMMIMFIYGARKGDWRLKEETDDLIHFSKKVDTKANANKPKYTLVSSHQSAA